MSLLTDLRAQRAANDETLAIGLLVQESRADHAVTADEQSAFNELAAASDALSERIGPLEALDARRTAAARANVAPIVSVTNEPRTYERGNGASYFADLARVAAPGGQANPAYGDSLSRLNRHAAELLVDLPARAARRASRAETELRSATGQTSSFEKRVNPNRVDGQGGYLVPPLWLVDEYIPALRAGRPFVNRLRQMDLPDGTDSINIPVIATGTATGVQTADAAAVSSTDFTDNFVSAGVKTIAGQEDVSMQLVEQSPGGIVDQVVYGDLLADYNRQCDRQSLNGSGASGQVTGVRLVSGTNAITYTDASPTVPELWTPLAQSLSSIAQNRFDLSGVFFAMHPRRWFWIAAGLDTANRPLVVPANTGALSPMATSELLAEGAVGNTVLGPPVIIDANIGTTYGAGTVDEVYAVKADDTMWFEGSLRTRVLFEILSGNLQVRFQIYNYVAQLTRYGSSISIISGTGLAAPAGF